MAEFKTRYSVGDRPWRAATVMVSVTAPCPDCLGKKRWEVTSPGGTAYTFACPRCTASYRSTHELSLDRPTFQGRAEQVTIRSIEVRSAPGYDGRFVRYFSSEGCCGSVYDDEHLYDDESVARTCADLLAAEANKTHPNVVEQLKRVEDICDYQLADGKEHLWEDRARRLSLAAEQLLEDLEYEACAAHAEVDEAVLSFRKRMEWER